MNHRLQALTRKTPLLIAILVIAAIGTAALLATHAATPTADIEPEAGTFSAQASNVASTVASGGHAAKFGTGASSASAANPCVHAAAPTQWKHVILIMFENENYGSVIGNTTAPYITNLANHCGSATNWKDGNYTVTGGTDGNYPSKPSYATLTSGLSPSVTGITSDSYTTTANVDNLFHKLSGMGLDTKSYQSGTGGSCAVSNFSGAYHDAMRYYTNLGAQSADPTTYCNTHDVPIGNLMTDINAGKLPAFSLLLPTNDQNMHNNGVASGDAYAKTLLDPILNSAQYKTGDTAIFFLWDEDTPIPNVMIAPSIVPGSHYTAPVGGNPLTHFSFTRTTQEMLGVQPPFIGASGQAPSLKPYFNGQ